MIELCRLQKELMSQFYSYGKTKVVFNKSKRNALWKQASSRKPIGEIDKIGEICPSLAHQIEKSYSSGANIQPAVFSECVYAQTFANMFGLNKFYNCYENPESVPVKISALLKSYSLTARYVYTNSDKSKMLIQAGGCNGIDSAFITVWDLTVFTIEFKEPGAKTSEPDLPKYKEDGKLLITKDFISKYAQFEQMLNEHKGLNFFDVMGNNVHNFSAQSVNAAVTNNYTKKYADVVVTEDADANLVMLPANQVSLWAKTEGEIRPAGRNHYQVWTPKALDRFVKEKGATVQNGKVIIDKNTLAVRKQRGGNGKVSGYKINPLFFVYANDCIEEKTPKGYISFPLSKVRQLNPTIAGKMFFENLRYDNVFAYYRNNLL